MRRKTPAGEDVSGICLSLDILSSYIPSDLNTLIIRWTTKFPIMIHIDVTERTVFEAEATDLIHSDEDKTCYTYNDELKNVH